MSDAPQEEPPVPMTDEEREEYERAVERAKELFDRRPDDEP